MLTPSERTIASVMIRDNAILQELGGEYIEDRIHGVVKWDVLPGADR